MQRTVAIGLILLTVGNLFSAFYDVSVKWLPDDANAATFLLVRQVTAVLMLLPLWLKAGRPGTSHFKIHLWRANTGAVGALFLIIGLMALPLATVSSLFYSAPLMIMVLGAVFLKEQITPLQWGIAALGFAGILLILRPSELELAGIAVLVSAFTFSLNQMSLRKLPSTEAASLTLLCYNLLSLPLILLVALSQQLAGLSWPLLGVALLSNAFLLAYNWFCVLAYRRAKASEIAVAEYSGLSLLSSSVGCFSMSGWIL